MDLFEADAEGTTTRAGAQRSRVLNLTCEMMRALYTSMASDVDISRSVESLQADDDEPYSIIDQIQASAVCALLTTCIYCRAGLVCLQNAFLFLVERSRVSRRSVITSNISVARQFCVLLRTLQAGVECDHVSTFAARSLVSLLCHSGTNVQDAVINPQLREATASLINDKDKDKIATVKACIDDVLCGEDMIRCTAMLRFALENTRNRDVDWMILFINRASGLARFNNLPDDIRFLPVYVSAIVHACGGCHHVDPHMRLLTSAIVGRLCAAPLTGVVEQDTSSYCEMHRSGCCVDRAKRLVGTFSRRISDRIHSSAPEATGSLTYANSSAHMSICCRRGHHDVLRVCKDVAFDDWWTTLSGIVSGHIQDDGSRKRDRAARDNDSSDDTDKESDRNDDDDDPCAHAAKRPSIRNAAAETTTRALGNRHKVVVPHLFGGPMVSSDKIDSMSRTRPSRSPLTIMCVLSRAIHEKYAPANTPATIYGPLYVSKLRSMQCYSTQLPTTRITSYVNYLKRVCKLEGLDALPFCEVMRAPVPIGDVASTGPEMNARWSAIENVLWAHNARSDTSGTLFKNARATPLFSAERAIQMSAHTNSVALKEGVPDRGPDGLFPLWLVTSDATGDYRVWPWTTRMSRCLGHTLPCRRPVAESHVAYDRGMYPRYITEVDTARGHTGVFFPEIERLYHKYIADPATYGRLVYKFYLYLVHRSLFGSTSPLNKRNSIIHFDESTGDSLIYPSQDVVFKVPRCPEFDHKLRYQLSDVAPNSLKVEKVKMRVLKSFDVHAQRRQREIDVRKRIDEVTIPLATNLHEVILIIMNTSQSERESLSGDSELVRKMRYHHGQVQSLLRRCRSLRSTQTRTTKHIVNRSCLAVPTVCQLEWYLLVGSIFYLSARVLKLDTDVWGHTARFMSRQMKLDINYNASRRDSSLGSKVSMEWVRSLATGQPMREELIADQFYEKDPYDLRFNFGWPFAHPTHLPKIEEAMWQWHASVKLELTRQREFCERYAEDIKRIRALYGEGGATWRRTWADMYRRREACEPSASGRNNAKPRVLSDGTLYYDPDLSIDPMWLAACYLPELKRCIKRFAVMYRDLQRDKHDAWWDMLEFTHGLFALERYVELVETSLKNIYTNRLNSRINTFFKFCDR